MATKLNKKLKSLKILSEFIRHRATKFGIYLYLVGLNQVSSNYSTGVKFDPTRWSQVLLGLYRENNRNLPAPSHIVQITVPKGDVTFRLVASGYRDKPDKIS